VEDNKKLKIVNSNIEDSVETVYKKLVSGKTISNDQKNLIFKRLKKIGSDVISILSKNEIKESLPGSTKQHIDALMNKRLVDKLLEELYIRMYVSSSKNRTKFNDKSSKDSNYSKLDDIEENHYKNPLTSHLLKLIYNLILQCDCTSKEKKEFIELISNEKNLISKNKLSKSSSGDIDNLLPSNITSSKVYKEIKPKLLKLKPAIIGAGEAFLLVFGANSGYPRGKKEDLVIDGLSIETKESGVDGSTIAIINSGMKSNKTRDFEMKHSSKGVLQRYATGAELENKNLQFLKALGFSKKQIDAMNTKGGKRNSSTKIAFFDSNIRQAIKNVNKSVANKLLVDYINFLYTPKNNAKDEIGLSKAEIKSFANDIYSLMASDEESIRSEINALAGGYIYNLYKQNKGFDVLIVIDTNGKYSLTGKNDVPKAEQFGDYVLRASSAQEKKEPFGLIAISHGIKNKEIKRPRAKKE
jgi:hypothetical protein